MDQKRTLWIVAAVGLFLLVVVGFALIIYAPERNSKDMAENQASNDIWLSTENSDFIPIYKTDENENNADVLPSDKLALNFSDNQLPSDNTDMAQNGMVNQNGAPNANVPPMPPSDMAQNGQAPYGIQNGNVRIQDLTVISENTKFVSNGQTIDLAQVMANQGQPAVKQNTEVKAEKVTPKETVKPSPKAEPKSVASAPAKTSAPKTTAKPSTKAASPKVEQKVLPKYWIQASSYSSKKNAEEARNALSSEKIPSEIFTYTDAKGTLFYRVRVGPYSTKTEAEYWQTRIKSIEKFTNVTTYITDSSAKK